MEKKEENSTSNSMPWFKEGLRFKCTECGKCCTGGPGYVWVTETEADKIAELLGLSVEDFKKQYLRVVDGRWSLIEKEGPDYDCIFLKEKKCVIYPVRPKQCRTFPWWKGVLSSEENWKSTANYCEGINEEAPIVPYTQIIQFLKEK